MRNIIHEIEMKRGRYNNNDSFVLIRQLENYETQFKGYSPIVNFDFDPGFDFESVHFIPVMICSAFESFFKAAIKEIIDLKRTNKERIEKIPEVRDFKSNVLFWDECTAKEISLGDVISHILQIKGIESIDFIFSCLTNTKFIDFLKSFIISSKNKDTIEIERCWLENYNVIIKDINSIYRLRNIICHEFGFWIDIEKETILRYLKNSIAFLKHVNFYFNSLYNPTPGKNNRIKELTITKKSFLGKQKQLEELVTKVFETSNNLGYDMRYDDSFRNEMVLWKKHRKKLAKSNCEIYMSTKNYPLMYWSNMESITTEKIDSLLKRHEALFFEAEVHSKVQKFD